MTLQQKIIEKQNKKGFTLVELVVVIAILAILAAVAVPAVISLINEASKSSGETNASAANEACNSFYTLIKTGKITNQSKYPDGNDITVAAAPGSSEKDRTTAAKNATVADALKYSGISLPTKDSGAYDSLRYYKKTEDGHVAGKIEYNATDALVAGKCEELAPATKLHELYHD
ncbi:MAG: prepilin-type N-terminal cleavage/methylation domain-containing protein [Acutalibacteraceae bacterium]